MTATDTLETAPDPPEALDVVETPTSPSSSLARSRFEFETDKRNEGTKILMVEWEDEDASVREQDGEAGPGGELGGDEQSSSAGGWDVSWEGKGAVLPVWDVNPETSSSSSSSNNNNNIRRVYFLLPPGAPIPTLVNIARKGRSGEPGAVLRAKPLPAIFPAELTSKQDAGRRGVLHTMWAKRRVAELRAEIEAEMRANGESVGLEMALQELQWIVDHFGLAPDPGLPQPTRLHIPQSSAGPASPRSPLGGRLGEKLRGLKLATSPAELAAASQAAQSTQVPRTHPLVSSVSPPATGMSVSAAPGSGAGGVGSLNAIVGSAIAPAAAAARVGSEEDPHEEDLFALPMSPRSPEMKRSPFSIL